jgi:hypothetical protein
MRHSFAILADLELLRTSLETGQNHAFNSGNTRKMNSG